MDHAAELLDRQLSNLGRQVLNPGGQIDHRNAEAAALREYGKFDDRRKAARKAAMDEEYAALKTAEKALPQGSPRRRQ
ncbi:hypothetical protein ABOZ73_10075 [Caulobacter sp. 73W]|uniref:Uncharacterized protein n=1 Tax=Caulobacter sp. 73W TaxID=3161137 RepID=A0AB39KMY2_9CAUL